VQPRRNMSGDSHDIPGVNVKREFLYGIGLGIVFGLVWKSWQWNNKAMRVQANDRWEKQWPILLAKQAEEREEKDVADAAAAAEEAAEVAADEAAEAE
jgi:hypothetical protein